MFKILYKYFIINRKLNLPGIGVLSMKRQPATLDFSNKAFTPPSSYIEFIAGETMPEKKFFSFLSGEQKIEQAVAVQRFKVFVQDLTDNLQADGIAVLPGLGSFSREVPGTVRFTPVLQMPA